MAKLGCGLFVLLLTVTGLLGCQTPVGVARVDPEVVNEQLTRNALSAGVPNPTTEIVLHVFDLKEAYFNNPRAALAELHTILLNKDRSSPVAFALSELSFLYAKKTNQPSYYLATALYAYVFLFPENPENQPEKLDSRVRIAADLYNRSLTLAFRSPDGSTVDLRSGTYSLPFGTLTVKLFEEDLQWHNRTLDNFIPTAELEVRGLQNRYRRSGIGVPLAANQIPLGEKEGLQIDKGKLPITALMRVNNLFTQLTQGTVQANWEVYIAYDDQSVIINGQEVPLEIEFTSSLAASLAESPVWERELKGFFLGDLGAGTPAQLAALEPYRPGRIPVVFVHGTASGPGRWADMLNDLIVDQKIRDRFQFWFFSYNTGNPILYSASGLHDALQQTVQHLGEKYHDPALQNMVVIGHSQGGLLTKLIAIDSGTTFWDSFSSEPLETFVASPTTQDFLRKSFFIKPLPFVKRVVFIATPHHGSYVAGSWIAHQLAKLVKLPAWLVSELTDVITQNDDALKLDLKGLQIGSIYGMEPGSPLMTELAPLPLAKGVIGHSIIAVNSEGPLEEGTDGVVKYTSARLDGMDSEFIVRSGHSCQSNPHTIGEVRRILLLHAKTICETEGSCS
ncbi:MAG: alpha/beta fold hydrolase [Nitrospirales bacterium]|nr:alpha/beta fold hydrolase [Nitrospirales bacterium]